jgi:hypothetical protein
MKTSVWGDGSWLIRGTTVSMSPSLISWKSCDFQ